MKRRTKLWGSEYLEVLTAHYEHYFYFTDETVGCEGDIPPAALTPYPKGFFDLFDYPPLSSLKDVEACQIKAKQKLLALRDDIPVLKGVTPPTIQYKRILGIKVNIKELTVPHFDGRVSTVKFTYHFHRIKHLMRFLFTRDVFIKAEIYNEYLKTREITVNPEYIKIENYARKEVLPKHSEEDPPKELVIESGEFTTRRQCLIVIQIIKSVGIDLSKVNYAALARLVHVLAAKEAPMNDKGQVKMNNSNIYKILKNYSTVSSNRNMEDLMFLKSAFEDLGAEESTVVKRLIKNLEKEMKSLEI